MQLLLVVALLFALAVAVFAVQNAEPISFQLFGWQSETSLVFVVLGAAAAGAIATGLVGLVRQVRASLRIHQLQNRLQKAEKQIEALQEQIETLERQNAALEAHSVADAQGEETKAEAESERPTV